MVCKIKLSGSSNRVALVDRRDVVRLRAATWHETTVRANDCVYAQCKLNGVTGLMHRVILNAPKGSLVDHINGNGLDNRRGNLRIVTPSGNSRNRKGRGASRFLGVRLSAFGSWSASTMCEGKTLHLGCYLSEEAAAMAYDKHQREHTHEGANLNFPRRTNYTRVDRERTVRNGGHARKTK